MSTKTKAKYINLDPNSLTASGDAVAILLAGTSGLVASTGLAIGGGNGINTLANSIEVDAESSTTTALAAVSVTATGVGIALDDSTLTHTGSSLHVKNQGIGTTQLGAVTGAGLSGGSGSAITLDLTNSNTWTGQQIFSTVAPQSSVMPTAANDLVRKSDLDAVSSGLDPKESVVAASTDSLDDNSSISGAPTYNNVGGTSGKGQITATLAVSDSFNLDGINFSSVENGSRILIKNENDTASVVTYTSVAKASYTSGGGAADYFTFSVKNNGDGETAYYVWFQSDGTMSDPSPGGTGIVVNITGATTADDVGTLVGTALNESGITDTVVIGITTPTTSITNIYQGAVTAPTDNSAGSIAHTVVGVGLGAEANGIWTTTISGFNLTLDRAPDFDTDAEVTSGAHTFVENGTVNDNRGYVIASPDPVAVGTASGSRIIWTQFSNLSTITGVTAGAGLTGGGTTGTLTIDVGAGNGITVAADSVAVLQDTTTNAADGAAVTVAASGVSVNGDIVNIDFTATNYTPTITGAPTAADVADLAAHLKGIDNALAGATGENSKVETFTAHATLDVAGPLSFDPVVLGDEIKMWPVGGGHQTYGVDYIIVSITDAGTTGLIPSAYYVYWGTTGAIGDATATAYNAAGSGAALSGANDPTAGMESEIVNGTDQLTVDYVS